MSTLREHIDILLAAKADGNRRYYEATAVLTFDGHLKEIAALLDGLSAPAICAARPIGGIWQCDHCGYFDLERPSQATQPALQDALDAKRYRWLREKSAKQPEFYSGDEAWRVSRAQGGMGQNFFGEKIDEAIDAAMQQGQSK